MIKEYIIKIDEDQDKKDIHGGYPLIEPPLELIRCKDCKHHLECNHWIENGNDWYCADGERKSADEILMEEMDADPLG